MAKKNTDDLRQKAVLVAAARDGLDVENVFVADYVVELLFDEPTIRELLRPLIDRDYALTLKETLENPTADME